MIEASHLVVRGHVSSTAIIDVCSQFFLAHGSGSGSGSLCFGARKRCFAGSPDANLWFVLLVLILVESISSQSRALDVAASLVDSLSPLLSFCFFFFTGRFSTLRSFQTRETERLSDRETE